jgi:succinylarginine dihydrolase
MSTTATISGAASISSSAAPRTTDAFRVIPRNDLCARSATVPTRSEKGNAATACVRSRCTSAANACTVFAAGDAGKNKVYPLKAILEAVSTFNRERNKVLLRRKFSRSQLLAYTANLPASLIGLEAGAGAHFLGRVLREQGHQVRLIPAQFVKPYRKSNKNDFIDAEAIAEAVTKQNMRFVQIKTEEQLDWQACTACATDWCSVAPR